MSSAVVELLIVDDRRENLLVIESILASPDYRLVLVTSGDEALKHLLERDFAAILLDVVMPGMDGFELATLIKQRERSRYTPIVFLTAASVDLDLIYRGYSVGAVDYLTKPIDADVLRAKVAIFVELYRKDLRLQEQADALRLAERRERELELAALRLASDQRYRNLAEAIPDIVWTAKPDGAVTYFNRRWFEYTGQTFDEATGLGWITLVHPDDVARARTKWREGVAANEVFQLECRLRGRDGATFRWHLCRAVPDLDGDGRVVGWLGTYTDFDDFKRARDAAEQAVRARDEFLSIASHELRTPLTTLQLRLQGLAKDVSVDAAHVIDNRIRTKIDSALRQEQRLSGLVDSLLDVSRITNGVLTLQRELVDLVELARQVVERFSEAAANAGVVIELRESGSVRGMWDRLRIEQIVQNLLGNALRYAPDAPVEISLDARDDVAVLAMRDHGPGISMTDRERIFGPYERAVSARNYGGLGLGLYIARQNVVAHGGNLRVASEVGNGATFIVELPLQPRAD
ncbi:MAG TPA: ATP-binding protein [Polyangiales bacterium]|nr:ATP-binding protein [Polyangiales bacterium]